MDEEIEKTFEDIVKTIEGISATFVEITKAMDGLNKRIEALEQGYRVVSNQGPREGKL